MTTRFRWILCLAFIIALTIPLGSGLALTTPACDPDFVLQDSIVFTVLPTGTDDTANLQCAFDAAVAAGDGAEVRLVAADYHTAQIVVYDFLGKFSGAGATTPSSTTYLVYPLRLILPTLHRPQKIPGRTCSSLLMGIIPSQSWQSTLLAMNP